MKESLLTVLRDKKSTRAQFRRAADKLAELLAADAALHVQQEGISVETPLGKAAGSRLQEQIVLLPILRAGLLMLPHFMHLFEDSKVGFFGIRRDEKTALPQLYYENLPSFSPHDRLFLLDPMIATGGSASLALAHLKAKGADMSKVHLIGILGAKEGLEKIRKEFPQITINVVAVDPALSLRKFIVPGLGDFGDRYFGTA